MSAMRCAWGVFLLTLLACLTGLWLLPLDMQIPHHWNIQGEPDRFGSLMTALIYPPVVMLGILLLLSFLKYFEPRRENLQQSEKAKGWIGLAVSLMLALIAGANLAMGMGYEVPMLRLIMVAIFILFIVIGNFLSKTRSNFFIGIRTPWTLSSDDNWRKTHHLGGRLFMLAGVLGLIISFALPHQLLTWLMLGLLLPASLIPIIYSWYLWHKDDGSTTNSRSNSK
ncbi:SdpI family protein [Thalassotalea litorea]|uniref:SdpI family protein n=1 Tax=Thalassotalea litorea TaxID=2020715 RepID=UPI003735EE61